MILPRQPSFFVLESGVAREILPHGGSAVYHAAAFTPDESAHFLRELIAGAGWRQESIHLYGKRHLVPRETAWFGDPGVTYSYSTIEHRSVPWTPVMLAIKARVEALAGAVFNAALANRYRNGADSVAWHADDEPELGPEPTIASVSFGATRTFRLKSLGIGPDRIDLPLEGGSLLIMRGAVQQCWKHCVPKERSVRGERVNITLRAVQRRHR